MREQQDALTRLASNPWCAELGIEQLVRGNSGPPATSVMSSLGRSARRTTPQLGWPRSRSRPLPFARAYRPSTSTATPPGPFGAARDQIHRLPVRPPGQGDARAAVPIVMESAVVSADRFHLNPYNPSPEGPQIPPGRPRDALGSKRSGAPQRCEV